MEQSKAKAEAELIERLVAMDEKRGTAPAPTNANPTGENA